jgi:hypothetical protein
MLWQTNRIKHQRPRNKQRLQLLHLVPADRVVAGMEVTVDIAAAADVARAVQVGAAVDAVKVADPEDRAVVLVDLAAASGNFSARKKSVSSVSRRWI